MNKLLLILSLILCTNMQIHKVNAIFEIAPAPIRAHNPPPLDSSKKKTHEQFPLKEFPFNEITESSLRQWILETTTLPRWHQKGDACIHISRTSETGAFTKKIYSVSVDNDCLNASKTGKRKVFIIKVFKTSKSAEAERKKLTQLYKSKKLRAFGRKGLPYISLHEGFYKTLGEDPTYFSVLHAAKGQSLWSLWTDYVDAPSKEKLEESIHAYTTLGKSLALMQLHFIKSKKTGEPCPFTLSKDKKGSISQCQTLNHGDYHPKNIYIDGNRVTLIDNASMITESTAGPIEDPGAMITYFILFNASLDEKDLSHYYTYLENTLDAFLKSYAKEMLKVGGKKAVIDLLKHFKDTIPFLLSARSGSFEKSREFLSKSKPFFNEVFEKNIKRLEEK